MCISRARDKWSVLNSIISEVTECYYIVTSANTHSATVSCQTETIPLCVAPASCQTDMMMDAITNLVKFDKAITPSILQDNVNLLKFYTGNCTITLLFTCTLVSIELRDS